ncbi:Pseudouridine-5'-phosphate glycosidase [Gossypium australe]|uniref:Pseudouridine-5'-phosphate glycosidase n=1 Tax=Gossypium australe TaxID=47621 RepID=A0A5B6W020_9ROSI|nr:Pseudouridine-5'-phosphate glycosidase [Gossypium australe]
MASSSPSSSSAVKRLSNLSNHLCPTNSNPLVKVSAQVSQALSTGLPVVALESTIISHGMPYLQNLETAKEVEAIVRDNGAVPATIAILDGVPCIGLNLEQLERLARMGKSAQKTARKDIAYVVATKRNGATTVSATMFFAAMVGIPVFVTGGVGGVHRHGEHACGLIQKIARIFYAFTNCNFLLLMFQNAAMDISSDLTELGRTPVAVVSAGVKSILDIPRTLEYLEAQGVCVAAYKTNEFPAFFY